MSGGRKKNDADYGSLNPAMQRKARRDLVAQYLSQVQDDPTANVLPDNEICDVSIESNNSNQDIPLQPDNIIVTQETHGELEYTELITAEEVPHLPEFEVPEDIYEYNAHFDIEPVDTISDDEDVEENRMENLCTKLRELICEGAINVTVTNKLLKILNECDIKVPRSYNTLMETPNVTKQPVTVSGGQYIHMGIQTNFYQLNYSFFGDLDEIEIDISFDGVPLFNSSSKQAWVLSGGIVNRRVEPFLIGLYVGESGKPKNPGEFFYLTLEEIDQLRSSGVFVGPNKIHKPFKVRCFISDSPARQMATGTLGHAGKESCPCCTQVGQKKGGHMIFSRTVADPRTNESFRNRSDPNHNKYDSIFTNYQYYDMVMQFPIDPTHACDLGIMRELIKLLDENNIVEKEKIRNISETMWRLRKYIPKDMERRPRRLEDRKHFKAVEYRLFALYLGMVALKDQMPHDLAYQHFLCFSIAYRLLLSQKNFQVSEININAAEILIKLFVENIQTFYGETSLVYNVHMLLHLPQYVKKYGSLDSFSSYRYENFYQKIKKWVRRAADIPQQVYNRWRESYEEPRREGSRFDSHLVDDTEPDNCISINFDKPFLIQKKKRVDGELVYDGRKLLDIQPFFERPVRSDALRIYKVSLTSLSESLQIKKEEIKWKNMLLPLTESNKAVIIPIIHYLS